jgi:hypothetical protein
VHRSGDRGNLLRRSVAYCRAWDVHHSQVADRTSECESYGCAGKVLRRNIPFVMDYVPGGARILGAENRVEDGQWIGDLS